MLSLFPSPSSSSSRMLEWAELALGSIAFISLYSFLFRRRDLDHIPTVGYSNPFLALLTSIKYIFRAKDILSEGYKLYPNGIFKFVTFEGWLIIVNGTKQVDDIRRATEDHLHGMTSTAAYLGFKYTLGSRLLENPYHIDIIRSVLTRNIGARYQDIRDEVERAYSDAIAASDKEWTAVPAYQLQVEVITKVSCRYFFGEPLCNDPVFRSICEKATLEIFKGRFIRVFPSFLKACVIGDSSPNLHIQREYLKEIISHRLGSRIVTNIHGLRAQMEDYLRPIMNQRLEQRALHGADWPGKPNDLISWLIDGAVASGEGVTIEDLSTRILFTCFGAIHTSSTAITAALFQLSLNPQDIQSIREEVETVVNAEGWSKASIGKMHKLDCYLRESQRMHTMSFLSLGRTLMKDFTFSDGTTLRKNTAISVNVYSRHRDEDIYPDPHKFDGYRFIPKDGSTSSQPLVATPTLEYHSFGHGRPACPGRFFAITEIKTMMAHLVTTYDIKLETDRYPEKIVVESNSIPNMTAKVLFRKRQP